MPESDVDPKMVCDSMPVYNGIRPSWQNFVELGHDFVLQAVEVDAAPVHYILASLLPNDFDFWKTAVAVSVKQ